MEKQLLAGKYPANIDIDKVQFLSVCCKWGTHKYEPPHFKHVQKILQLAMGNDVNAAQGVGVMAMRLGGAAAQVSTLRCHHLRFELVSSCFYTFWIIFLDNPVQYYAILCYPLLSFVKILIQYGCQ